MDERKRKGRPDDQGPEPSEPPAAPAPAQPEEPRPKRGAARKAGKPEVRKVKMTFSLEEGLARRLTVTAAYLRVDVCDLIDRLIRPQLKGFSAPTIPDGLIDLFPPGTAPAS